MTHPYRQKTLVMLALLLWLFSTGTGMHGHYCYDGIEPPVSLHFDAFSEHEHEHEHDHHNDLTGHVDLDSKAPQISAIKLFNTDLIFLALIFLLTILWPVFKRQVSTFFARPASCLSIFELRPPLRAPPQFPA